MCNECHGREVDVDLDTIRTQLPGNLGFKLVPSQVKISQCRKGDRPIEACRC